MKIDLLKDCKLGNHKFEEIDYTASQNSIDVGSSTKWCKICGSVVMDRIIDNRTAPGYYMRLKSPEITKLNAKD